mmetsp:Transcript_3508/g.5272  ORF Transcript_3508/g.5272 Transcript_3508/m.5272 type:complete len:149 (+) Transcript_3508:1-447(+)
MEADLEVLVDFEQHHFPFGFEKVIDQCLAMKYENEFICVNRIASLKLPFAFNIFGKDSMDPESIENVTYPVYQTGIYAVVFNPLSEDNELTREYTDIEFYYKNNLLGAYVILGTYCFFGFIFFISISTMIFVSCRRAALVRQFRKEMI